jgi:hypothetical protein
MEVKINGELIEIGNSMPAITRKSIDINNPSARFLDITNKFQLPYTTENAKKFGHPDQVGSDGRAMDTSYDVVISDVFQMFAGKGYVNEINKDSISLQCVDKSSEVFKALDLRLNQINWDDKDTVLTQAAIDALDAADLETCWFWGKACYHANALQINTDQTTGDSRTKYSRPAFYVQGLLNRALVNSGYTIVSPVPDLAIGSNHKQFFFTSYQKSLTATYNPAGTLAIDDLDVGDFNQGVTVTTTTIAISTTKTVFRLRGTVTSDAEIDLIIRATDDVDGTKVTESKVALIVGTQDIDFTSSEFQSDDGITVDIRLVGTGEVVADILLYTLVSDQDLDLSGNPFLNYKIKAHDNFPEDLTYLDLMKLICIVSNQYPVVDTYNKTFSFGSLANINKLNAVDWSDKFIIGSEQVTSQFPGLFQNNWLKYTNDITVSPELGWSSFLSDNENMEAEGDYIVLKFGASKEATINSNDIAHVAIYNDTTRIADQEISPRLFIITGSLLQSKPLYWTNLVLTYYGNWFNSLFRIRALTAEFDLSKLDVLKWDEKQLVYIDHFKSTFFVLEISNFIPGRKTKVKLLNYGR